MPGSLSNRMSLVTGALSLVNGWQRFHQVQTPAPGTAIISHQIGGPEFERIRTLTVSYSADATVGNRYLNLDWVDGDGNIWNSIKLTGAVAASASSVTFVAPGNPTSVQGTGTSTTPMPDIIMPPGWSLQIRVAGGVGPADQASDIFMVVDYFPSDAVRFSTPVE